MEVLKFKQGSTPLLISIPHVGTYIPSEISDGMTDIGRIITDTDFYLDKLYSFTNEMGVSVLSATHSRYVIDLNRSLEDENLYPGQIKTGLIPLESFSGEAIYRNLQEPDEEERQSRIEKYWQPYHKTIADELMRIKEEFGYAILYDAHSIACELPRLFDDKLPDLNLGTVNGDSCLKEIENTTIDIMKNSDFSYVANGRFIGGYITRNYGSPADKIYSLQMEMVRENYMNSDGSYADDKAEKLQKVLKPIIKSLIDFNQAGVNKGCSGQCQNKRCCQSDS